MSRQLCYFCGRRDSERVCNCCGHLVCGRCYAGNGLCNQCHGNRQIDAKWILRRCEQPSGGNAFRHKESTFGDPNQIAVMKAINCDGVYCNHCFTIRPYSIDGPGQCCPECHMGTLLPGAMAEPRYREMVEEYSL